MSQHRVLLVEDSSEFQLIVRAALQTKYDLRIVGTFTEALAEIEKNTFSLLILDIGLPDGDGFKLCAQAKLSERNRSTPIVFLSGKNQVSDKVMALSLGADDYIVKPFDALELQARVAARIRSLEERREVKDTVNIGPFRVTVSQHRVMVKTDKGETQIGFTTMEFKLFYFLLSHEHQVLSREQILNQVWGALSTVTDRTVDTHIYTIRQKLGNHSHLIQSVSRAGYRYGQTETKASA